MLAAESATTTQRLKGILSVTVLQASGLPKVDWIGENDTYCVIALEGHKATKVPLDSKRQEQPQSDHCQRTQVQPGCNPVWNEKLAFSIPESEKGPIALSVKIWDDDYGHDDLIASGVFDLSSANLEKDWMDVKWVELTDRKGKAGPKINVVCHYIPESMGTYFSKKYDAKVAAAKSQITKALVTKLTGVATSQINSMVGL